MRSGGNIYKILPPNLHSCASLGLTGFARKKHPQNGAFSPFWGKEWAFFGGVKCALEVIHLKWCITTHLGPLLGDFERKMCKKSTKHGREVFLHTSFWLYLG